MEFDYTITTAKSFAEAVLSVEDEIGKAGMRVLYVHDVQKTLDEKGFKREPFKIVEFCKFLTCTQRHTRKRICFLFQ